MDLAPICLFTYNRLETTKKSVESLRNCLLASESDLVIFSDGPKNSNDANYVRAVREYLKTVNGFKSILIKESIENKGLANSIISGVSEVINSKGRVIVLEDDLIVSASFLSFMNESLDYYAHKGVFSITGFSLRIKMPTSETDVYFTGRASSWGWATWSSVWSMCDWEMADYDDFKSSRKQRRKFDRWGSDMSHMLDKQMAGKLNSWAIRWCYSQFKLGMLTVVPRVSLVRNAGFGNLASNTIGVDRYPVIFDDGSIKKFRFSSPKVDEQVRKQFTKYYSFLYRAFFSVVDRISRFMSRSFG